jgi:uncharacterized membrane protein YhhN
MLTIILSLLTLISAAIYIWALYRGPRRLVYIFKPLTTTLILLIALLAVDPPSLQYKILIVSGLAFSLAADILLMLPTPRLIPGLASFSIAHLLYIAAFASDAGFYLSFWAFLPLLISGAIFYRLLWPGLGRMKVQVFLYTVIIIVMVWQAFGRWEQIGTQSAILGLVGATLFAISDSIWSWDRFRKKSPWSQLTYLPAYFVGQWLIALSVVASL